MAFCQNCGSDLHGPYCNECGARAPEEKAAKKPKPAPVAAARPAAPRGQGPLSPGRIGKTTTMGLLAVAIFAAGMVAGFWIAAPTTGSEPITSTSPTAENSTGLPPIALAGQLMDEGVDFMQKGERTAATDKFRKAAAEYEKILKAEPDNLYAQTYLGLNYYYLGDSTKALTALRNVLGKDPDYLWAIFNLAWIYETGEKKPEALLMYQKYLAVADKEKANITKYAEQYELIDRQVEAAKKAVDKLGGTGK